MASVKVLQNTTNEREIHRLFPGGRLTHQIGRDEGLQTILEEKAISRRHCMLVDKPGKDEVVVIDLGSTNKTYVNGKALNIGDEVTMKPKDILQLGGMTYHYLVKRLEELDANDRTLMDSDSI